MQRLWSPAVDRSAVWNGGFSASSRGLRDGAKGATKLPRPYSVTSLSSSSAENVDKVSSDSSDEDEDPRVRRMRLEAVLLISKAPVSPRKLAQLAHLADATEARTLVRQLNRVYDTQGRAIRVEHVAGGFRMLTHPMLAPWLARLGHLPPAVRLSTPMMETLAVVAYRQPVSRAGAEAIRGVACGELLRQLMERDLIRITGRSEELGRPYLYGTTKRFLQVFGLSTIDTLPPIDWQMLQEDSPPDLPLDDLSTPTKESVVSTSVAPVLSSDVFGQADIFPTVLDPTAIETVVSAEGDSLESIRAAADEVTDPAPQAIIEDEEDEDDDWDDDDDDDWDDDDEDDDDEDDDDEEDEEDDELDDDWEEVDDDDDDDDEEDVDDDDSDDDDDEESDEADDDEDWSEDEDDVDEDDDDDNWD
ncbi:MAG: SMC-Scp complex subunit ScpB [Rubripirellula sp.]